MRRFLLLLCALAAMSPWTARAAAPSHRASDSAIPTNFAVLPGSQPKGQPVKRVFTYTLARGHSLTDSVMVVNPSKTDPLTVRLSVSDAVTMPQGGGMTFNDSTSQRQIGRWLQLGSTLVTVPPYHIVYVPIALRLPASIPPGEYEGAINAIDVQSQTVSADKVRLRVYLNRRCLVLLRVAGHAAVGLRVTQADLERRGSQPLLHFTLLDTGTVTAYPTAVTATITDHGKSYIARVASGAILGGDSTAVLSPLTQTLAPGAYDVRISVAYAAHLTNAAAVQHLRTVWSGHLVLP
jgi:hypothetical protein